jgi:hypothetical protein
MILCIDTDMTNTFTSLAALLISIIALVYTVRAFLLKSGHKIRCDITTCSTTECEDNYVRTITLENLKDRASVIFKIYLRFGRSNYLLLEDFSEKPLILKPFEVYYKEYDPIIQYSCSLKRVKLDNVFSNDKVKRRIILSTTDGRYIVKTNTKRWEPIKYFFRNYFTALIDINRLWYKEKAYGENIKFLIVFKFPNGKEQIVPVKDGDEKLKIFQNFQLTSKSLKSKSELEKFLSKRLKKGELVDCKFEVKDFASWVDNLKKDYKSDPIYVENDGFFKYNILGRYYTIKENRRLKKENQALNNERERRLEMNKLLPTTFYKRNAGRSE